MYIPSNKRPAARRLTKRQKEQRTKAGIWLAVFVIVIGAAWGIWEANNAAEELPASEARLRHDLQVLWEWSDEQLKTGSENGAWAIRWNATGGAGTMDKLSAKLFTGEDGESLDKVVQNEGKTIAAQSGQLGGRISVSLLETDGSLEQLMLTFDSAGGGALNRNGLLKAAAAISEELTDAGADFTSSLKVQGLAAKKKPVEELMKRANAKPVDRYEEDGTVSATLFSGKLRSSVDTGGGKMANLQIALHKETNSEQTALTIGIPVITGDYSAAAAESR
ncbi:YwmB family TATA-box binding protein [Paenibacillus sp. N4]|uniref:YwmB family TATA-box binding protein n=1 Tax=Paenibacillus vietnamensis TaxID=2590547 RepID=UPI001CD050B6|nr:YwmB family TATA-box binding protein [Paenibacillus vietnamensis]MCA0757805.1 YwmB family TATA-box binding protein [Paenibacillus vietnamensis]